MKSLSALHFKHTWPTALLLCATNLFVPKVFAYIPAYTSPYGLDSKPQHTQEIIDPETNNVMLTYDVSCKDNAVENLSITLPPVGATLRAKRGDANEVSLFLDEIGQQIGFERVMPETDEAIFTNLCRDGEPIKLSNTKLKKLTNSILQFFLN